MRSLGINTHDPEQPPLHLGHRNHVSAVLDHVGDEEGRKTECRVEVRAHDTERPEEPLHRQEAQVDLAGGVSTLPTMWSWVSTHEEVEREEAACRASEVRHEVDYKVVDEDPNGRERDIRECVRDRDSGRTVESIIGLRKRQSDQSRKFSGSLRTCLLRMGRPSICTGIYGTK